jgi:hypothetical protein
MFREEVLFLRLMKMGSATSDISAAEELQKPFISSFQLTQAVPLRKVMM